MVGGPRNHRLDGEVGDGDAVCAGAGDVHESGGAGGGITGTELGAHQHLGTGDGRGLCFGGKVGNEVPVVPGGGFLQQVRESGDDGVGDDDTHGLHQRGVMSWKSGWMLCM